MKREMKRRELFQVRRSGFGVRGLVFDPSLVPFFCWTWVSDCILKSASLSVSGTLSTPQVRGVTERVKWAMHSRA